MFCSYSTMLGEVNQGIHAYRVLDIAIVDVIGTFCKNSHFIICAGYCIASAILCSHYLR